MLLYVNYINPRYNTIDFLAIYTTIQGHGLHGAHSSGKSSIQTSRSHIVPSGGQLSQGTVQTGTVASHLQPVDTGLLAEERDPMQRHRVDITGINRS